MNRIKLLWLIIGGLTLSGCSQYNYWVSQLSWFSPPSSNYEAANSIGINQAENIAIAIVARIEQRLNPAKIATLRIDSRGVFGNALEYALRRAGYPVGQQGLPVRYRFDTLDEMLLANVEIKGWRWSGIYDKNALGGVKVGSYSEARINPVSDLAVVPMRFKSERDTGSFSTALARNLAMEATHVTPSISSSKIGGSRDKGSNQNPLHSQVRSFPLRFQADELTQPNADDIRAIADYLKVLGPQAGSIKILQYREQVTDSPAHHQTQALIQAVRRPLFEVVDNKHLEFSSEVLVDKAKSKGRGSTYLEVVVIPNRDSSPQFNSDRGASDSKKANSSCYIARFSKGLLSDSIRRTLNSCGYRLGSWNIGDDESLYEIMIESEYAENIASIEDYLNILKFRYGITGTLAQYDLSIAFDLNKKQ